MRRSLSISALWIPLVACVLLGTGCQRSGPTDPGATAPTAANSNVIDAVPLPPEETPPPAPQTATPAPEKAKPETPAEEPQATIPEGPDMAPVRVPVSEVACRDAIGASAAARLVERCIQVSPATRPPCNAANPCDLIQGEIDRSCKLWARDGNPPAACKS